jgi:hypothetical protein
MEEKPTRFCVKCRNYFHNDKQTCTMPDCGGCLVPIMQGISYFVLDKHENPCPITIRTLEAFRDQLENVFITNGQVCWPIDSQKGSGLLAYEYRLQHGVTIQESQIEKFKLEARTQAELKPAKDISLRTSAKYDKDCEVPSHIYWDLTDDEWHCVDLTPDGWTVIQQPAIFKRSKGSLPMTIEKGTQADLDMYIGQMKMADKNQELLKKVYLATALIPDISHPIKISVGTHGGAKTTGDKADRYLIDDAATLTLTLPKEHCEIIQQLDHNLCAFYDNISTLSAAVQDIACKASTGDAGSKRKLYSDDDDHIYKYRRLMGFNSREIPGSQPDFLDRGLIFRYERLSESERKRERQVWFRYQQLAPKARGRLADVLVEAMKTYSDIEGEFVGLTRMADFLVWGEACARAMGYERGTFLAAYQENTSTANTEVLEGSELVSVLKEELGSDGVEDVTMSDLLSRLKDKADSMGIQTKGFKSKWPQTSAALGRELRKIDFNLRQDGWIIEFAKEHKGRRLTIKPPSNSNAVTDSAAAKVTKSTLLSRLFTSERGGAAVVTDFHSPLGFERIRDSVTASTVTTVPPSRQDVKERDGNSESAVTAPSHPQNYTVGEKSVGFTLREVVLLKDHEVYTVGAVLQLELKEAESLVSQGVAEFYAHSEPSLVPHNPLGSGKDEDLAGKPGQDSTKKGV